jgi:hypothetical protein
VLGGECELLLTFRNSVSESPAWFDFVYDSPSLGYELNSVRLVRFSMTGVSNGHHGGAYHIDSLTLRADSDAQPIESGSGRVQLNLATKNEILHSTTSTPSHDLMHVMRYDALDWDWISYFVIVWFFVWKLFSPWLFLFLTILISFLVFV